MRTSSSTLQNIAMRKRTVLLRRYQSAMAQREKLESAAINLKNQIEVLDKMLETIDPGAAEQRAVDERLALRAAREAEAAQLTLDSPIYEYFVNDEGKIEGRTKRFPGPKPAAASPLDEAP